MRKLSLIFLLAIALGLVSLHFGSPSPHGSSFKYSCELCHNPESWAVEQSAITFDHSKTAFPLEGVHISTECRDCHVSLVFSKAIGE